MQSKQAVWLAALALLVAAAGCGGGDGGSAGGGDVPTETRSFVFTVAVPGATSALANPTLFVDEGLTERGVEIRSATQRLATTSATVDGQQSIPAADSGFQLAVHFDASGSIDDNGRDPAGNRFAAARGLIAGVGQRAGSTTTRVYTFRSSYANQFKLVSPSSFPASNGGAMDQAIEAVQAEGALDNSPALTATMNIIDSLPAGVPHAMLLLTDGENNAESRLGLALRACSGEGGVGNCSDDIGDVVALANSRNVSIFVAGLGNNDTELEKFRSLASGTDGAYVKVTRAEQLESRFQQVGELVVTGGHVVDGKTGDVTIAQGGNPFVSGFLRFDRPGGSCPGGSLPVTGTNFCRVRF